jgi:hypothetical protein
MADETRTSGFDYDGRMQANLLRVFSERDVDRRMIAIRELYADDAVLFEPDAVVEGHAAIGAAVEHLLARLPPGFVFASQGPALGHHGLARLLWRGGPLAGC